MHAATKNEKGDTMEIVLLHNHYDAEKLAGVVADMETLGVPTIRVYDLEIDDLYQAIEGSHRLRACEILNIEPTIEIIDSDTPIEGLDLDVDFLDDDTVSTLGDWENYRICVGE